MIITGLSGVGKTQIVYEAFKGKDNIYYAQSSCEKGNIEELIAAFEHGVIIVDNAQEKDIINAKRIIENSHKSFRIIIIINSADKEVTSNQVGEYCIDREKSEDIVNAIVDNADIQEPGISAKIKEYSGGIPLLAKELIDVYRQGGRLSTMQGKDDCFNRIINPKGDLDPNMRNALYTIAAFNPFGYRNNGQSCFDFVVSHPYIHRITLGEENARTCFENVVKHFSSIGLLDERAGGFIDVRAWPLANWLGLRWFTMIPQESWPNIIKLIEDSEIRRTLSQQLSSRLKWLDVEEAREIAKILNTNSFHNEAVAFTQTGSELLSSMAVVSPESVATNMFSLLEHKSYEYIQSEINDDVRRNIVWALETCCGNAQAFPNAAKALALLSIGENEGYGNNATGVFQQLFHIVLSGTEAPYGDRIEVLSYLKDKGKEFYMLIIKAIDCAFSTRDFHRFVTGAERINGAIQDKSLNIDKVYSYWEDCKDILIKVSDSAEIMSEIRERIPHHVYDFVSYNRLNLLCDLFDYYAPKFDYDWLEMRQSIHWICRYRESDYLRFKSRLDEMTKLLAPKSFKKAVKVAIEETDYEGFDHTYEAYVEVMKPYAELFVKDKIWEKAEFSDIADDNDFNGMWLAKQIILFIDKYDCRDMFYAAITDYMFLKDTEYRSQFILSMLIEDENLEYVKVLFEKLLENKFYNMATIMFPFVWTGVKPS